MKRVLITGGTGLIGRDVCKYANVFGYEVFAPTSSELNLFDCKQVANYMGDIRPQYMIHLAWITGGNYLTNPINEEYRKASIFLLKQFIANGGIRTIFAGTYFEYEIVSGKLNEQSIVNPKTLYAQEKNCLRIEARKIARKFGIEFVWGRIFNVFGYGEKQGRLTPSIITSLMGNKEVVIKYGQLKRDYMYSKEIARAFIEILCSNVLGEINICTGMPTSLEEYAELIGAHMEKKELIRIRNEETDQITEVFGDNKRLIEEVGFVPKYSLDEAISEILSQYRI